MFHIPLKIISYDYLFNYSSLNDEVSNLTT